MSWNYGVVVVEMVVFYFNEWVVLEGLLWFYGRKLSSDCISL